MMEVRKPHRHSGDCYRCGCFDFQDRIHHLTQTLTAPERLAKCRLRDPFTQGAVGGVKVLRQGTEEDGIGCIHELLASDRDRSTIGERIGHLAGFLDSANGPRLRDDNFVRRLKNKIGVPLGGNTSGACAGDTRLLVCSRS